MGTARYYKRIFDVIVSFLAVIVFIIPILIISLSLMISYKTPDIFFIQKRIGLNGIIFKMIKFRTMVLNDSNNTVSVIGDDRITKTGKFLRKYKLDELPEIVNVLIGDMSIVGPRPDVPGYADKLPDDERRILSIRPGITGPASLKYFNEEDLLSEVDDPKSYNDSVIYPDKVRINLLYIDNYSFLLDLKIIWYTIRHKKNIENIFSKGYEK